MLPSFDYIRPKSVQAVITHLATGNAQAHAGGTDLMGCLREHIFPVGKVVSLSGLSELRGVSETADGGLRIGALTTLSALAEHPVVILAEGDLGGLAVDLRRGGEDHPLPVLEGEAQDRLGAADVGVDGRQGILEDVSHPDRRGEMEDTIHGGDEPFQEMLVEDGVVDEVEHGIAKQVPDVFDLPRGEIVDDEDLVSALDECVNQMRADVPGAAGN